MSFLQLVLLLDKTIEGINSILPIVSYRNTSEAFKQHSGMTNCLEIITLFTHVTDFTASKALSFLMIHATLAAWSPLKLPDHHLCTARAVSSGLL